MNSNHVLQGKEEAVPSYWFFELLEDKCVRNSFFIVFLALCARSHASYYLIFVSRITKTLSDLFFFYSLSFDCASEWHFDWFNCNITLKNGVLVFIISYDLICSYVLGAVFLQLCKALRLDEHPIVQKLVDPSWFIHRFTESKCLLL